MLALDFFSYKFILNQNSYWQIKTTRIFKFFGIYDETSPLHQYVCHGNSYDA